MREKFMSKAEKKWNTVTAHNVQRTRLCLRK